MLLTRGCQGERMKTMEPLAKNRETNRQLTWTRPHTIPRPPGRKRAADHIPGTIPPTCSESPRQRQRQRTESPQQQYVIITPAHSDLLGTNPREVVPTDTDFQWANDMLSVSLDDDNNTPEIHQLNSALLSPSAILTNIPSLEHGVHSGASFENTNIEHHMPDGEAAKIPWVEQDSGLKLPSLRGFNALHIASHKGQAAIIRMLLATKSHLDVDSMTSDGRSALHIAALAQHVDVVEELLRAGANALLRDGEGQTAMHMAAQSGNIAVARQILSECSECLPLRDSSMQTPLHHAVIHGHEKMVKFLLEKGADPAAIIL